MRIVHIPHAYHPVVGGAEAICKRVSEMLVGRGHDVLVITTNVGGVQGYYEFGIPKVDRRKEMIDGVRIMELPFSGILYRFGGLVGMKGGPAWLKQRLAGRIMGLLRRRLAKMIMRQIVQLRPDVVMTMPHLVVNVQAVLAARKRIFFPLVMVPMLHEQDPAWDAASMKDALRSADAVIALTPHEVTRLVEAYGVARKTIFHASIGIDLVDKAPPLDERYNQVLFLGRQVKSKGISDLIEAMRFVWNVMPDADLVLAGIRVPESVEIDEQIAALPEAWRKQVRNFGAVSEEQKDELLGSSRCLVLPSKTESFGIVIVEAWSRATPVVAWDLPVFRSIIEDGRTGVLVDPSGGPLALSRAILRILQDTKAAKLMGEVGQRHAANTYSWKSVAAVYLKAYEYAVEHAKAL